MRVRGLLVGGTGLLPILPVPAPDTGLLWPIHRPCYDPVSTNIRFSVQAIEEKGFV
jgi:hypothetical protein